MQKWDKEPTQADTWYHNHHKSVLIDDVNTFREGIIWTEDPPDFGRDFLFIFIWVLFLHCYLQYKNNNSSRLAFECFGRKKRVTSIMSHFQPADLAYQYVLNTYYPRFPRHQTEKGCSSIHHLIGWDKPCDNGDEKHFYYLALFLIQIHVCSLFWVDNCVTEDS